jgi:hypothetical protein
MNDLELLMNKIPKEHWTEHGGKPMLVRDLIKILDEEIERIDREKKAVAKRKKKEARDEV